MAVRTDQREIGEPSADLTTDAKRNAVVALDVLEATVAVSSMKAESARFTGDSEPTPLGVVDLVTSELRIPLTPQMRPEKDPALVCAMVLVDVKRD